MFLLWQLAHWLRNSVLPASTVGAAIEVPTKSIQLKDIKKQYFNKLTDIKMDVDVDYIVDIAGKNS